MPSAPRDAGHERLGLDLVEQPSDVQSPVESEVLGRAARENALEEKLEDGDTVDDELNPLTVEPIKAAFVRLEHSFQNRLAVGIDMPASHTPVNVVLAARDTARPRTSRAGSAALRSYARVSFTILRYAGSHDSK